MTYRGDILGRFDPSAYRLLRTRSINAIQSSKYQSINLKDVVEFRKEIVNDSSELPYVGLENIQSNTGVYVPSTEEKESFNSALKFEAGDVLFPKLRPYLNKVHLAQFNGVCSTEFHVLKGKNLNNLYLFTFLSSKLVVNQTTCLMTGNTLPRLQPQDVQRLQILLPPLDIQNHIAGIMQSAYAQKKQKEQEADVLLDSIDDYVLSELGIEIPAVEEKKCFVVYANERVGRRIDSHFHQPKHHGFKQALEAGKYRVAPLSSLITDLKNGVEIRTYSDHGYRYLRVSDLGKNGIENHNPRYVDVEEIPNKIKLTSNSFLISRSGSLGLVSVVEDEIREAILSSHIFKVGLNTDQILPRYLEALFRSQIGQTQFFQNNNGGVIPEISQSALKSISVVVPPSDVQEQIAEEAMRQRSEAMKLRQEADAIVEAAKREVERVMLEGVSG